MEGWSFRTSSDLTKGGSRKRYVRKQAKKKFFKSNTKIKEN